MKVMVLGSGQDAGVPQAGCGCPNCQAARGDMRLRRKGPSVAVYDEALGYCFLIDASPDFGRQLDLLPASILGIQRKGRLALSGILLTHAHYGHCAGLWQLGREVISETGLEVHCSPKMARFLKAEHPFADLAEEGNIEVVELPQGMDSEVSGMVFSSFTVPHRNEYADTVGYVIGEERTFVYLPDLDRWTDEALDAVLDADLALIDGTFYSRGELPRFDEVPHPPMRESMGKLTDRRGRITFTHLNHTNPVCIAGGERAGIEAAGFGVAYDGMVLDI